METQTILKIHSGSTLFGLRTEHSDEDIRGCVLPLEIPYLIGFKQFEQIETKEPDTVLYNLPKFIALALKGNTGILECLAAPNKFIIEQNHFGLFLRNNLSCFLAKQIYKPLKGFATSEYYACIGKTTGVLGKQRKNELALYQYSPKNACHCIRLLFTGYFLFKTGAYITTFTSSFGSEIEDIHKVLMNLKLGKVSKEYFVITYQEILEKFEKAFATTYLPKKPKTEFIEEVVCDYISDTIATIKKCQGAY